MTERKLPYGVEHIEQFLEHQPTAGVDAFAWALGDAMEKSSGKYYRVRWEAYEEHFDHVITKVCIEPVYKDLETDKFKLPPYKVTASKERTSMRVNISFEYGDRPNLDFAFVIEHFNLYDEIAFNHLSYQIYRHFKNTKDDVVYGSLWNQLSHNAKELFLYELGVTLQPPRFTPQSAVDEIKSEDLMLGAFNPTDKGHELIRWLHRSGQIN